MGALLFEGLNVQFQFSTFLQYYLRPASHKHFLLVFKNCHFFMLFPKHVPPLNLKRGAHLETIIFFDFIIYKDVQNKDRLS